MDCAFTYGQIVIFISLVILLVLAASWEFKDYKRIKSRPYICDIKSDKDKQKEMEFYACFNSKNNIQWRGIFIMTFVSTFLVTYIISQFYDECINFNLPILIFGAILLVFYIGDIYKNYHLYREMCYKVKGDKNSL